MGDESPSGPRRLGRAGIGSIGGGLALGTLSIALPYAPAAGSVLVIGIAIWAFGKRISGTRAGIGIGCAAVGAIGLFEAFGLGLGLGPGMLAVIAIAAGVIDVFVGGTLGRMRTSG